MSLTVFALLTGALASFAACLVAVVKLVQWLKKRWVDEAMESNSLADNTKAIKDLTSKMENVMSRLERMEGRQAP